MTESVARGEFDVVLTPIGEAGAPIGPMSISKTFRGDLAATSAGQMLAFRTRQEGSAGYVAMEQVTGVLAGRSGTFVLQHSGTMNRGVPSMTVSVVPDSGTDGLAGITGNMAINITSGQHHYSFDYTLPQP